MKKLFFVFSFVILICITSIHSQTNGNIPLLYQSKFTRFYGSADVWGFQLNSINYALTTIDGGLSIVNTNNPSSSFEVAHINHSNYLSQGIRLKVVDVETFLKNGIMYAYLATDDPANNGNPLVIIINLNVAISQQGLILFDPVNGTPNPNLVFAGRILDLPNVSRSHTLTIEDGYLYVASRDKYLPVWDLKIYPTNPNLVTTFTLNASNTEIHEMFVQSNTTNQATVYAACVVGGLQILNITYIPTKAGSVTANLNSTIVHLYDFDKAYPNQRWSGDQLFDFRHTHSAWPTQNQQYIFTTDELAVWPPNWPYQYSNQDANLYRNNGNLRTPRREGAYLRAWSSSSFNFVDGYYVSEEHPWGLTDLTQIDTFMVPNTIHQMSVRGNYLFISHYTQGFRMVDITNPQNMIEVGYYDDYPSISFNPSSSYFFRSWYYVPGSNPPAIETYDWAAGIYGVFPDPYRNNICYAGGTGGFYIFEVTPPPFAPTNLTVQANAQSNYVLTWIPSSSSNIQSYKIYRADVPLGEPYILPLYTTINAYSGGNPVTSWEDISSYPGQGGGMYYYQISAVNTLPRESVQSNRVSAPKGGIDKKSDEGETEKEIFEYSLSDNYPNPFNPTTIIDYSLKENGSVTLKVFDVIGKEVRTLVDEEKESGSYSIKFNASNLPSGIYFYTLTTGNFVATKKLILLK